MAEEVKPDPPKGDTPVEPKKTEPTTPAPPDWFLPDKYKTIEDQAKGTGSAVQKMREVEADNKILREERDALAAEREAVQSPKDVLQNPSDELIVSLERKFGKSYEEIKAEFDMKTLVVRKEFAPIKDAILGQQYETVLSRMEQDNELFKKFRPQVEAKLAGKSIEEKADSKTIKSAWNAVIAENIEDIRSGAIEEGKKLATAEPADKPDVSPASGSIPVSKDTISLSEEEKTEIKEKGGNPEEVEKYYKENLGEKRKAESGWGNMFEKGG